MRRSPRPRLANRQEHRSNIQAQDCSGYYRLNLTIPLLDHLISELDTRFNEDSSQNLSQLMLLLPSTFQDGPSTCSFDALINFCDLPHPSAFDPEYEMWRHKWESQTEVASKLDTPEKTIPHADKRFLS